MRVEAELLSEDADAVGTPHEHSAATRSVPPKLSFAWWKRSAVDSSGLDGIGLDGSGLVCPKLPCIALPRTSWVALSQVRI